ncbi:MAG: hypothetical protein HYW78_04620 [Parcubacteria group bacterium]|nr:hypothetical protein [Parcubacteria group bacterium]
MPKPHKKLALLFTALSTALLAILFWTLSLQFYRMEIIITPKVTEKTISYIETTASTLYEKELVSEQKFTPSNVISIDDFANGEVSIINNSRQNQILVKNTRLLSPEGLLFRIQEKTTIPSKKSVKASVKADQKGPQYEIGPTKFTIPGLSEILQKQIYAESDAAMQGGSKQTGGVSEADIEQAKKTLRASLSYDALEAIKKELKNQSTPLAIKSDVVDFTTDVAPNTEASAFSAKMKLSVRAVPIDETALLAKAEQKLDEKIEATKTLVSVERNSFSYKLKNIPSTTTAELELSIKGNVILSASDERFVPLNFVNRDRKDIEAYIKSFDDVESITTRTFPWWLEIAPTSEKRIVVKIVSP